MSHNWEQLDIALEATINDVSYKDIVAFNATYELNAIPSAQLTLATGVCIQTNTPATIHSTADKLKTQLPVHVRTKIVSQSSSTGAKSKWPADFFEVFDGLVAGTSWTRSNEEANFVVPLIHWLDGLNSSSALSATSHPGNPADFNYGTVFPVLGNEGAGTQVNNPAWLPLARQIGYVDLVDDFWGRVLWPILKDVASQDRFDRLRLSGANIVPVATAAQLAALERLGPGGDGYVPLSLDLSGLNAEAVQAGVSTSLRQELLESWQHTTLWGKLVGDWSPDFGFVIVPRVSDAMIVPFSGSLRGGAQATFRATDYNYVNPVSSITQGLQAVGIMHTSRSRTGVGGGPSNLVGQFPTDPGKDANGLFMIKSPPRWLKDPIQPNRYARASLGINGLPGDATDPKPVVQALDAPADTLKAVDQGGFLDRWAQHLYLLESLRGNTLELAGKLRFDIAPGSTVAIELPPAKQVVGDALEVVLFGTVMRVSFNLDAQNQRCGTSFVIGHLRTAAENADTTGKYTADRPPMYTKPWYGSSLVKF